MVIFGVSVLLKNNFSVNTIEHDVLSDPIQHKKQLLWMSLHNISLLMQRGLTHNLGSLQSLLLLDQYLAQQCFWTDFLWEYLSLQWGLAHCLANLQDLQRSMTIWPIPEVGVSCTHNAWLSKD